MTCVLSDRSMGVVNTSSSPPNYTKRLSGVPAEFVKQHLVGSPTGMKSFADSVDGAKSDIIPVKCDVVLKGFCLSASLLPSLRAGYKVCFTVKIMTENEITESYSGKDGTD